MTSSQDHWRCGVFSFLGIASSQFNFELSCKPALTFRYNWFLTTVCFPSFIEVTYDSRKCASTKIFPRNICECEDNLERLISVCYVRKFHRVWCHENQKPMPVIINSSSKAIFFDQKLAFPPGRGCLLRTDIHMEIRSRHKENQPQLKLLIKISERKLKNRFHR